MFRAKTARLFRRSSILLAAVLVGGVGIVTVPATAALAQPTSLCPDATYGALGPNVCVFTPSMSQTDIQNDLNAIAAQQVPISAQFDDDGYAIFFEPGTYGSAADPLVFQVGYYTQVAGLGATPQDTVVNGQIDAFANVLENTGSFYWTNSDDNFWRSLSNLTLNSVSSSNDDFVPPVLASQPPISNGDCWSGTEFWSVSQAAPLRSVIINGNVVFQQYCTGSGYSGQDYASGGFIANSEVNGDLDFYGQQQYYTRDSDITQADGCGSVAPGGGLWNEVYSGVVGAPSPEFGGQCAQNTVLPTTPVTEEPPFLYLTSAGTPRVFVPTPSTNTSGPNFLSGSEAGISLPISDFFIANPNTSVASINAADSAGKDIIFTPGVYNVASPIVISRASTIILSLGFATFVPTNGNADMDITPNTGVKLAGGIIFDAGATNSPVLLEAGTKGASANANNPDLFSDVFFRVGGAESPASATVSFVDYAPNSIIDDLWAWRADHGENANSTGWTVNVGDTGVVVDANNVNAYGLFVEHYEKNEVVWAGQGGSVEFFQNELPYDVPTQADWMATPTQDGYPAFLVTPNVTSFNGYGMGSYVTFLNTTATLYDTEPFEAPDVAGVQFTDLLTVYIGGNGGDDSIINGVGPSNINPPQLSGNIEDLASYPGVPAT